MEFVFDLQRFADNVSINWNVANRDISEYYYYYTGEAPNKLDLNSNIFSTDRKDGMYVWIMVCRIDNVLAIEVDNWVRNSNTNSNIRNGTFTGNVIGNIDLENGIDTFKIAGSIGWLHSYDTNGDDIYWASIGDVYAEVTGLSAGKWKLEGKYNAIDYFEPAGVVRLNDKMFSEHTDATILYYNAAGEIIGQEADAAVIVERKDSSTTNSYTVTVNSQLSTSLITIEGVAAEVTDSKGTEYRIKNGPTFKATDAFSVNEDGAFTATGKGITVTKGDVTTAGKGTFTVNGIAFTAEEGLTATLEAGGTGIVVDKAITAGTTGKNYTVGDKLYKSVSSGVQLTSSTATLDQKGQSVTVNGHDAVTNNGTVPVEVSSQGAVKLAVGGNFKMGGTTYTVAAELGEGYVGTVDNPQKKTGYIVKVNDGKDETSYILSKTELLSASVTDVENTQGELWNNAKSDLLLPAIPIMVNAASESNSYKAAGFVATAPADTAATVTKKSDGTYAVVVKDKILIGVNISGVTATLTDSGTETTYKASGGSFQLAGTGTLDEKGLLTFEKARNSVTINGFTYTLDKVNDKVSLDTTGKLTSLTDGEKVTVTKDGVSITYEVSGGELLLTKNDNGTITTTTNLLAAGEKDGFIIQAGAMEAVNRATEAVKSQSDTGLVVNTESVDDVTNGMLLDKSGQATLSEDKAVATVTILENDSLKYTAKEDKGQVIKVTEKSSKTWEITASRKKDTIEYGGSGEASIFAGAGNDDINITGSGDVKVLGESGNNNIVHTGSGDATLQGGTGNDTIKSSHADDIITGGEGNNTYILTGVTTKVNDFAYGRDKAVVTSQAGALDIAGIKANPEGTISYKGAGAAGGALDVASQGYGNFYAATLTDVNGKNNVNVSWTGESGGMVDASALTDKFLLLGNNNGASDSLLGGKSHDTIVAGTGNNALWGGAGNDLIESNGEASHSIFFLEGDGNDTVKGFTTYGDSSSDNADTLNFMGQNLTGLKNTSQGLQLHHSSGKMLLSGNYTANTMFKWESGEASGIVKVGKENTKNNFTYHGDVTGYLGSKAVDTLSIGADEDNLDIWLDGSKGKAYDSVEIVDAGNTNGSAVLAGGAGANTIIGGKGNTSLWGGAGEASDLLKGGSGEDVFYYGQNDGNDIIKNASAEDKVLLYNLSLSDLKGAEISSNKLTITQSSGQTLTINGRVGELTLSDGSTWAADYSTKTWSRVK